MKQHFTSLYILYNLQPPGVKKIKLPKNASGNVREIEYSENFYLKTEYADLGWFNDIYFIVHNSQNFSDCTFGSLVHKKKGLFTAVVLKMGCFHPEGVFCASIYLVKYHLTKKFKDHWFTVWNLIKIEKIQLCIITLIVYWDCFTRINRTRTYTGT